MVLQCSAERLSVPRSTLGAGSWGLLFQVGEEGVVGVKAGDGADELAEGGGAFAQVVELVGDGADGSGGRTQGRVVGGALSMLSSAAS